MILVNPYRQCVMACEQSSCPRVTLEYRYTISHRVNVWPAGPQHRDSNPLFSYNKINVASIHKNKKNWFFDTAHLVPL